MFLQIQQTCKIQCIAKFNQTDSTLKIREGFIIEKRWDIQNGLKKNAGIFAINQAFNITELNASNY